MAAYALPASAERSKKERVDDLFDLVYKLYPINPARQTGPGRDARDPSRAVRSLVIADRQGAAQPARPDPVRRAQARRAHLRTLRRRAPRRLAHADPHGAGAAGGGGLLGADPVRRVLG